MSADDYTTVEPRENKYVLFKGCASNDFRSELGEYDTLEEAVRAAPPTEYGLAITTKKQLSQRLSKTGADDE